MDDSFGFSLVFDYASGVPQFDCSMSSSPTFVSNFFTSIEICGMTRFLRVFIVSIVLFGSFVFE